MIPALLRDASLLTQLPSDFRLGFTSTLCHTRHVGLGRCQIWNLFCKRFTVAPMNRGSVQKIFPTMATVLQQFPSSAKPRAQAERITRYAPLASVWNGDDAELLEQFLDFYPRKKPKRILDATVNGGRFWRGSKRPVIGLDIEANHKPDLVADNTVMPFQDGSFDVLVYDPPHIPNQGRDHKKDFNKRFGLDALVEGESLHLQSHISAISAGSVSSIEGGGHSISKDHRLRAPSPIPMGAYRVDKRRPGCWLCAL